MECVTSRERGTTAGFTHTAFDLGGGLGAGLAGLLISDGGFTLAFGTAAVLIAGPAYLYDAFFHRMEECQSSPQPQGQGPHTPVPTLSGDPARRT
jgi:predicted MFS family arabinose efflux permease